MLNISGKLKSEEVKVVEEEGEEEVGQSEGILGLTK